MPTSAEFSVESEVIGSVVMSQLVRFGAMAAPPPKERSRPCTEIIES